MRVDLEIKKELDIVGNLIDIAVPIKKIYIYIINVSSVNFKISRE